VLNFPQKWRTYVPLLLLSLFAKQLTEKTNFYGVILVTLAAVSLCDAFEGDFDVIATT